MAKFILAIDQGTTSSRVIIFNKEVKNISFHQKEFKQYFPKLGYVLHDADEIWESVVFCMEKALQKAKITFN